MIHAHAPCCGLLSTASNPIHDFVANTHQAADFAFLCLHSQMAELASGQRVASPVKQAMLAQPPIALKPISAYRLPGLAGSQLVSLCNCCCSQTFTMPTTPCHALLAGTYSGDATVSLSPRRSPKGIVQEVRRVW